MENTPQAIACGAFLFFDKTPVFYHAYEKAPPAEGAYSVVGS
jgi:hypothetical protein